MLALLAPRGGKVWGRNGWFTRGFTPGWFGTPRLGLENEGWFKS